jgi:hypothetical protein
MWHVWCDPTQESWVGWSFSHLPAPSFAGTPAAGPARPKSGQAECAWPAGERRACRHPALTPPPAGHRPNNHPWLVPGRAQPGRQCGIATPEGSQCHIDHQAGRPAITLTSGSHASPSSPQSAPRVQGQWRLCPCWSTGKGAIATPRSTQSDVEDWSHGCPDQVRRISHLPPMATAMTVPASHNRNQMTRGTRVMLRNAAASAAWLPRCQVPRTPESSSNQVMA